MEDNSSAGGQQGGEPGENQEPQLTERQLQQQNGWNQLAQGHRDVIQTALKEPTEANLEALRKLEKAEPKFAASVLKDFGYDSLDGYASAIPKKNGLGSIEEITKMLDEREQAKATAAAKASIDSQFAQLPEAIRQIAQDEFNDLIEGKKLTPEKMADYAKKSVMLANQSSGNQYKMSALSFGSTGMSSSKTNVGGDWTEAFIAEKSKGDDFYKFALKTKS